MNIIEPASGGAFVYYDGLTIRGISFVANPELSHLESFYIDADKASEFINGGLDLRHWVVWTGTLGPAMYHKNTKISVISHIDENAVLLPETQNAWIVIKVFPTHLVFYNKAPFTLETEIEDLQFLLTQKGDPSGTISVVHVAASDILSNELLHVELPVRLTGGIDIYTRRLFDSYGVCVRKAGEELPVATPKGHFVDLMRFEHGSTRSGLQAVHIRSQGVLRLSLVGDDIGAYDRPTAPLRLIMSTPDDPSIILCTEIVPLDELRQGVDIKLPQHADQFDVWSPLVYHQAYLNEIA